MSKAQLLEKGYLEERKESGQPNKKPRFENNYQGKISKEGNYEQYRTESSRDPTRPCPICKKNHHLSTCKYHRGRCYECVMNAQSFSQLIIIGAQQIKNCCHYKHLHKPCICQDHLKLIVAKHQLKYPPTIKGGRPTEQQRKVSCWESGLSVQYNQEECRGSRTVWCQVTYSFLVIPV